MACDDLDDPTHFHRHFHYSCSSYLYNSTPYLLVYQFTPYLFFYYSPEPDSTAEVKSNSDYCRTNNHGHS